MLSIYYVPWNFLHILFLRKVFPENFIWQPFKLWSFESGFMLILLALILKLDCSRKDSLVCVQGNPDLISNFSQFLSRTHSLNHFTEQFWRFVFVFLTLSMQISIGNIKFQTVRLQPKKTEPLCSEIFKNIKL